MAGRALDNIQIANLHSRGAQLDLTPRFSTPSPLRVLKKGLRRREGWGWGALLPNPTPASFPFAAAELQQGRRLACYSTLSPLSFDHPFRAW